MNNDPDAAVSSSPRLAPALPVASTSAGVGTADGKSSSRPIAGRTRRPTIRKPTLPTATTSPNPNTIAAGNDDAEAVEERPGGPLTRVNTAGSIHARNALRRMATHETGEFVCEEQDGAEEDDGLHTHDELEHEQEHSDEGHANLSTSSANQGDEESRIEGKAQDEDGDVKMKKVELQDQTNLLPPRQVIFVFIGLTCALFCSLLDQTIVTTALPTLGKVFNRADISSWVGTSYLLTSTAVQPIYGRVSDIFGRKFTLIGCLFIFLMGSMACALAQTMIQLIIFRAIQGIGGGGILTLSMIIISDVVFLKERGKYQGIAGGVVALANSCGPILGGVFTEKVTWRWCFYINLPLTAMAMVIIIFLLPLRRVKGGILDKLRKLDVYGSVLTLAWAVLVLIALSWGGSQYSWSSAAVLAPLIIGLSLLGLFLYVEGKLVPLPLVPLHLFKTKTLAACYATTFLSGFAFYATLYYLPQYFQVVRGDSAIRSGVLTLPLMLTQTFFSFGAGILQSKTGDYWWNLVIGFGLWSIGLGLLSSIDTITSEAKLAGYQVLVGIGAGQTFQTSLIAIQAAVPRKDMATATGLRNFLRMLGGTIALAVCGTIVNNTVKSRLSSVLSSELVSQILADPTQAADLGMTADQLAKVTEAYARGINGTFWFCAPCSVICFILTILFIKRIPLKREDDAAKKAEAKAWIESKKAKKHAHSHSHSRKGSHSDETQPESAEVDCEKTIARQRQRQDSDGTVIDDHTLDSGSGIEKVKKTVEDVAEQEAEAAAGPEKV